MRKNQVISDIPAIDGPAVYSLVDDCGMSYIGSSMHLQRRIRNHEQGIREVQRTGRAPFLNGKMTAAVIAGRKFRCKVLAQFPNGTSPEILEEVECLFLSAAGGIESTYNMRPMKRKPTLKCQPGDILEYEEEPNER